MSTWLRVGGMPLSDIGNWGSLTWSLAADGGCKDISWQMDLPQTFSHPLLARGVITEVMHGPFPLCTGVLTEPDADNNWTLTAQGLSALAADYLCFDSAYNTTSIPDVAIARAISDGLPWSFPTSISNVPFGSGDATTSGLNTLTSLLDAYAQSVGKRWGVDADRQVYCVADPTTPSWFMLPGAGRFGLADDNYASHLYGRYETTGGTLATILAADTVAESQLGRKEAGTDMTPLGPVSGLVASNALAGKLALGEARMGFTNGVGVNPYQLTTTGGVPASLQLVEAGDLVRMFGVIDEQGQPVPYLDWVIGETSYEAGSDTIGLTPVGLVDRELSDAFSFGDAA